jgi:membrane protease YdiL (CAAX protease family)
VEQAPESALFRRQYALLLLGVGRLKEADREFARLRDLRLKRGERQAPAEYAAWKRLLTAKQLSPGEADALRRTLGATRPGRFAALAWERLYQLSGRPQMAVAARRSLAQSALSQTLRVAALIMPLLAGVIAGIVFLIVLVVVRLVQRVPLLPRTFALPGWLLLEGFILYMALTQFLPLALSPWLAPFRAGSPQTRLAVSVSFNLIADVLCMGVVVFVLIHARRVGATLADMGLHLQRLAPNIGWGFAAYFMTFPLAIAGNQLAERVLKRAIPNLPEPYHPISGWLVSSGPELRFALYLLAAVGAPLVEEIFFRGMLYGAIRRHWGVVPGVLLSSFVFAVIHPQVPLGFTALFILGAGMALAYEMTGSLVPGIVLHWLNNSVALLMTTQFFPSGG